MDWRRGNYAVLTRGGRVESPAGSGGLKKQVQMIAEGSVLSAASELPRLRRRRGVRRDSPIPCTAPDSRYRSRCRRCADALPPDMSDPAAGGRWPQAQPHRLHGLERPRERARPVAHFPSAGQGTAPGRLPDAAQERPRSWTSPPGAVSRRILPAGASPSRTPPIRPTGTAPPARACTSPRSPRALRGRTCPARPSRARCEPAWCSRTGATACCRRLLARVQGRALAAAAGGERGRAGARQRPAPNRMRFVSAGDSAPVATSQFKVYLLRTSTLQPRGGGFALGWKQSPRGSRGWRASRREHADLRRNGRPRRHLRGRLEREDVPA